jgi:hypothetical protein
MAIASVEDRLIDDPVGFAATGNDEDAKRTENVILKGVRALRQNGLHSAFEDEAEGITAPPRIIMGLVSGDMHQSHVDVRSAEFERKHLVGAGGKGLKLQELHDRTPIEFAAIKSSLQNRTNKKIRDFYLS